MALTGTVSVILGESSLGGKLLAIKGDPNPFGAATDFLANRNIVDNTPATITGSDGFVGTKPVFFITSAVAGLGFVQPLSLNRMGGAVKPPRKATAKKSAKKGAAKKSAKKSAKKVAGKKSAIRRQGSSSKKSAKRASKKGSRK